MPQFVVDAAKPNSPPLDVDAGPARLQAGSPWAMRGHDAARAARTPVIGPRTPTVRWTAALGDRVGTASPVVAADGTVYIGTFGGAMVAIDAAGHEKWRVATEGTIAGAGAIGEDGTLYFGSDDTRFYAVDTSGTIRWTRSALASIASSPAIGPRAELFFTADDNTLYAFDSTASTMWGWGNAGGDPVYGASTVYTMSTFGNLEARTVDGAYQWAFQPAGANQMLSATGSAAMALDGSLRVVSEGAAAAVSQTGVGRWTIMLPQGARVNDPAIDVDGTMLISVAGDGLRSYDPSGSLKWSLSISVPIHSSPAIGGDGTSYLGADDGKVYAVDASGGVQWTVTTGSSVGSSPAIGADGTIYIGSDDGFLYAIGP